MLVSVDKRLTHIYYRFLAGTFLDSKPYKTTDLLLLINLPEECLEETLI